jgi:hypothetical protein
VRTVILLLGASAIAALIVVRTLAGGGEPVSVLFVGNSYTTSNDLPAVFADLASAGGYDADVGVVALGGAWLRDHVDRGTVRAELSGGDWDYVVLQEQSIVPASPTERTNAMFPAIRQLASVASQWDTEPVLYLTWAHRDGFPDVGYTTYEPMQRAVTQAYELIADEVGARVAPVGEAWAVSQSFDLYQSDGSHPTLSGTYLAASVLYATIFGEDPGEVAHRSNLDTADQLRAIAGRVVLDDRDRWHVPADG